MLQRLAILMRTVSSSITLLPKDVSENDYDDYASDCRTGLHESPHSVLLQSVWQEWGLKCCLGPARALRIDLPPLLPLSLRPQMLIGSSSFNPPRFAGMSMAILYGLVSYKVSRNNGKTFGLRAVLFGDGRSLSRRTTGERAALKE